MMSNTKCAVVGVGMTPFGKWADQSLRQLCEAAVRQALADADLSPGQVEQVFFANAAAGLVTGQEMIRGQAALRHAGLLGLPIVNVENACASGSSALNLAVALIESGRLETALVVGAEKLTHQDKRVSLGVFGSAVDLEEKPSGAEARGNGSLFMDIYARKTREFMRKTGVQKEDFARVVVKSRRAASLNPNAQFREPMTIEEVLAARTVSDPLTLPMCSPIGDGAAALLLCSAEFAKKQSLKNRVWVGASVMISGLATEGAEPCAQTAARLAYEQAGVAPADLDVVELHDASAPAELMHYENLGLCAPGDSASLLRSGATDLDGRVSVNPSGGLLSRGHPLGATGVAQVCELAWQLRGMCGPRQKRNARVALAENNGGQMGPDAAAAVATILHV